jgi:hypothetical protein
LISVHLNNKLSIPIAIRTSNRMRADTHWKSFAAVDVNHQGNFTELALADEFN